jgi:hypothetical protein
LNTLIAFGIPDFNTLYVNDNANSLIQSLKNNPEAYGFNSQELNLLTLGKGFEVYLLENGSIKNTDIYYIPLLYNETIRGFISVKEISSGQFSATISKAFADELNSLERSNGSKYMLVQANDEMLAINDNNISKLAKYTYDINQPIENVTDITSKVKDDISSKKLNENNLLESPQSIVSSTNNLSMVSPLSGPYLSNDLPISIVLQSGQPTCWAATIAAITNYLKGTAKTAIGVATQYPSDGSMDSCRTIYAAYSEFVSNNLFSFPWSTVTGSIDLGLPMHTFWLNSTHTVGHSMTLKGYYSDYTGIKSYAMIDPNFNYYVEITGNDTGTNVHYQLGSYDLIWQGAYQISR